MKKRRFLSFALVGCFTLVCGNVSSQTSQQSIGNIKIQSLVEVTSDTRSSVIGSNDKNISTSPTGRKQPTTRQIEFKKEGNELAGFFTIKHIKATIYGSGGESTYDSENTFERSGNAAMFAIRADPWVGKKTKARYDISGSPLDPINDRAFLQTWLIAIPLLSNNPEWSGLLQTSFPKAGWEIGVTWIDTLRNSNDEYFNTYKIASISNQTISISINGLSKPLNSKPVASLNSPSSTSESKGSIYSGVLEISKTMGIIKRLELKRETEMVEVVMNTKIASVNY
jgi:hypothetical protein